MASVCALTSIVLDAYYTAQSFTLYSATRNVQNDLQYRARAKITRLHAAVLPACATIGYIACRIRSSED